MYVVVNRMLHLAYQHVTFKYTFGYLSGSGSQYRARQSLVGLGFFLPHPIYGNTKASTLFTAFSFQNNSFYGDLEPLYRVILQENSIEFTLQNHSIEKFFRNTLQNSLFRTTLQKHSIEKTLKNSLFRTTLQNHSIEKTLKKDSIESPYSAFLFLSA